MRLIARENSPNRSDPKWGARRDRESRARARARMTHIRPVRFRRVPPIRGGRSTVAGPAVKRQRHSRHQLCRVGRAIPVRSAGDCHRKQDGARLFANVSATDINTRGERKKKRRKTVPRETIAGRVERSVDGSLVIRVSDRRCHASREGRAKVTRLPPSSSRSPCRRRRRRHRGKVGAEPSPWSRPEISRPPEAAPANGAHLRNARSLAIPPGAAGRRMIGKCDASRGRASESWGGEKGKREEKTKEEEKKKKTTTAECALVGDLLPRRWSRSLFFSVTYVFRGGRLPDGWSVVASAVIAVYVRVIVVDDTAPRVPLAISMRCRSSSEDQQPLWTSDEIGCCCCCCYCCWDY